MSGIIGDSASEAVMIDAVLASNFDSEKAINTVLNQLGTIAPKFM